ncbi:TPA: hypothetical protein ACH3X1_007795 [Trebouxia sp. C0004]
MVRQGTAPIKPETKGTGSIPVRSATVPVATVPGRAAAGPARPRAAKGRAGPALVGKATHQKAASGPAVGSVSSGASRVAPVTPIWAAAGPAIGKVFPTHGSQAGLQRDAVLPGRAAARPTEGNVGSVKGRVGSSPGRVIHAPRLPSGHVQARQASQRTTEPEKQLNNHTAHLHGRGQNSQAKATHVNQLRTPVMTVPQHHQPAAGNARNAHVSGVRGADGNQVFSTNPNADMYSAMQGCRPGSHNSMPGHMHQEHSGYGHGSHAGHHMGSHMGSHMDSHMNSQPRKNQIQETNFSSGHNSYRGKFPPANNTTQFGHGLTEGSSSGEASSSGDGSGDGASSSGDGSGGVSRRAPAFRVRVLHGEQEQKNAIWHYNNKAKTAEAACSIARSLELSIGQSSTATRACALDWYLKVTKSRAEGQVKQYAERRIAELQDLIAGSLGQQKSHQRCLGASTHEP